MGCSGEKKNNTRARTQEYNIAASWAILYFLTPGPCVSPHHLFYFEMVLEEREQHTQSFSFSHLLLIYLNFALPLSFLLYSSAVSGLPF
jgi:hypothetical protein